MPGPVGIAAAESSVREEGPVTRALVQTSGSRGLAVCSSPANRTVTFSSHAHASSRAGRIHAVHYVREGRGSRQGKQMGISEKKKAVRHCVIYTNLFIQCLKAPSRNQSPVAHKTEASCKELVSRKGSET